MCSALGSFKVFTLGGAPMSEGCIRWAQAQRIPLVLSIGMTELGGGLFHQIADVVDSGWPMEELLIPDAQLTLVDDDGNHDSSEGELYISSKLIASGYLNHDSSAFSIAPDGLITFKTGDRYALANGRLKWLGRKDDFIMLVSGETVDPRVLEKSLDACPSISRSCVIGNNFLRGSAQFICALVELRPGARPGAQPTNMDISRAVRGINRELAPPLRINWSRVIILEEGQLIPINRKGQIWRKKLETLFGHRVPSASDGITQPRTVAASPPEPRPSLTSERATRDVVLEIVAKGLCLSSEILELNAQSTFAELGMDSAAALVIVRKLNERLKLNLPRNTCHTHIDLNSLTTAILELLSQRETTTSLLQPRPKFDASSSSDCVVIVGQAVRLPGDLNTPEAFWEALVDMREDLMVPIPTDRWDHASFYRKPGDATQPCDITFEKAGFVDVAHFDNAFFGISSAEALSISPAIRLILETTFQALESANIPSSRLRGTDTGVFVGGGVDSDYGHLMFASTGFGSYTRFHGTGLATSTACGRLSYLLDVHGPSVSIDTACSGGMVAFDQAVRYLRSGQAETAIVSGANTRTWPGGFGFLSAQKMVSPNSRCATFASDADGYVPSEGAVSLILKTQRAALRDGDTILAVIKSTGTKHNGKSQGLVAPSATGQAALQRALITAAAMFPSDIDFVETHGTGTSLGDLIEIEGINSVFQASHTPERPLILGAAKVCIGHTEVVAGLAGIVKAIKQLSTGKVAGLSSVAGGRLNPELDSTLVPIQIPSELTEIPKRNEPHVPYRSLVVAYGFAGTLAGTILEAPPPRSPCVLNTGREAPWMIFTLSAKSRDALRQNIQHYLEFCMSAPVTDFQSICYTSCVGRELYRHRFVCVVKDLDGLVQRLKDSLSRVHSTTSHNSTPRTIFAFPGQGSQFYGMASALAERFADFREIVTDAANMATSLTDLDILSLLLGRGGSAEEIDKSAVAQICIFVYQYSVCQFLLKIGVRSDAVIGNSLGEISAAVEAGALSYELGLRFVVARAKILSADPDHPAGMAAIAANESTILQSIHDLDLADRVVIAVFSSQDSHVVSGDLDAVHILVSYVKKVGTRAILLQVDQGFHSHCIDGRISELEDWINDHAQYFRPLERLIFSTVLGKQVVPQQFLHPRHWVDHARKPVQLQQAAAQLKDDKHFKHACILDVGPTPTALAALQSNNMSDNLLLSSAAKKGKDQEFAFLTAIASLTEYGINPDFVALFGTEIRKLDLPTYPFQRQRHYPDFVPSRTLFSSSNNKSGIPSLVVENALYGVLDDHRIQGEVVLPGAAMIDAFARVVPNRSLDIRFHRPLVLQSAGRVCRMELGSGGAFAMYDGDNADKICSGHATPSSIRGSNPTLSSSPSGLATVVTGDTVYQQFVNIQFGPLFRNIVSIHTWDNYAEGLIVVAPSSNPDHDRIRALDSCIHMFGALAFEEPESVKPGAFLPMTLEGYFVYSDVLPSSFVCRYRLPLVLERNNHIASTAFEVISHSGELLVSCAKYSVAWVDMDVPPNPFSFQQVWIPKQLPVKPSMSLTNSKIVIFGRGLDADWVKILSRDCATEAILVPDLAGCGFLSTSGDQAVSQAIELNATIILDATGAEDSPEVASFSAFWHNILLLMKALGRHKTGTFAFIVLSTTPCPGSQSTAVPPVFGPMVQGMLRVFRRELGIQNAYGIELPQDVSPTILARILGEELGAPRGTVKDNMVSYRRSPSPGVELIRFVPELRPLVLEKVTTRPSGIAVIIGMGSIGFALGSRMIAAGFSSVVFIGRRPATDEKVAKQLSALAGISGRFAYLQADASDLPALRHALKHITDTYGVIKSIIHTAASVSDARIDSISLEAFDQVLRPKLHGAYNLHLLAEELALELDSFVLFSSISVPLGNPGQVAYVAANAFLDSLAAFRQSRGLPGVSLQLGPWESELVDNLPAPSSTPNGELLRTMTHKEGLPLIIRALSSPSPVQVLAALDTDVLSRIPAFANDSLFSPLVACARPTARAPALSSAAVAQSVVAIVRGVLELAESEPLELNESLSACGIDSIAFGQIRVAVLKQLGVEVPLVYLSDAFSVSDMIGNVQENVLQAATQL
ncbi:polyketide synthetase [Mycena galericulata]|nr:polyketide synthetase [Mycena galericulata]